LQETLKANPYVYAANDQLNVVDPSGACNGRRGNTGSVLYLDSCQVNFLIIAGGVAGAIVAFIPAVGAFLGVLVELSVAYIAYLEFYAGTDQGIQVNYHISNAPYNAPSIYIDGVGPQ
jgi:hypothetical protein